MEALILSPHPDDMEYNMGGTVILLKEKGWILTQIVFSNCEELRGNRFINGARISVNHLNIKTVFKEFPNQEFLHHRSIIREIIYSFSKYPYDVVFVPCRHDWHQDHQVVTEETMRVFRRNATILGYIKKEVYHRHYDLRVDLTEEQDNKRIELLALFGETNVEPINPEWFEVIQLRNFF